jgi:hypothetical protein
VTDEPAVLTWMIALAPQPRRQATGHHWWRDYVTGVYRDAAHAWQALRESDLGMQLEESDFVLAFGPRPTLKHFLTGLSYGRLVPENLP